MRLATTCLIALLFGLGVTAQVEAVVTVLPGSNFTWDGINGPLVPSGVVPNNLALAANGSTAFARDALVLPHTIAGLNNGVYGNSNSWIGATSQNIDVYNNGSLVLNTGFAGIALPAAANIGSFAFGRSNLGNEYADRTIGNYYVQTTQVASPNASTPDSAWTTIGSVNISTASFGDTYRHEFTLDAPVAATGMRVVVPGVGWSGLTGTCIDEIELYAGTPPVPMTGLSSWLAADRGVVTDGGGNVTTWTDQSGSGHNAVPGAAPSLVLNALAGKPVVRFSNEHLNIHDTVSLGMQNSDYEMFVVARSGSSAIQFLTAASHTAGVGHYELHLNGAAGARFIPSGWADPSRAADIGAPGAYTNGQPHLFNARVEGDTGIIRVGGIDSADTVSSARSASGQWLTLGVRGNATYPLAGDIAEVLIYNQPLTGAERVQVEKYLSRRWQMHYTADDFYMAETGGSLVPWNVAAQSQGGVAFAKDVIPGYPTIHAIPHLNDETYGNSNSWIAGSANSFAGVAFDGPYSIDAIAFGRDNGGEATQYVDRYLGAYSLQYTRVPDPNDFTSDLDWIDIATLVYDGVFPDTTGYLRHLYRFDTIHGVTGVRILTSANGICIDEFEVNAVPIPEPVTLAIWLLGALGLLLVRRRRG
jgi:hypothetical protein